jgi:hypothetical protein
MSDTKELLQAICKTYGRDIFTLKELTDILLNCDYTKAEARQIILESLNTKQLGRVSLQKLRRMPAKTSFVAILTSCK